MRRSSLLVISTSLLAMSTLPFSGIAFGQDWLSTPRYFPEADIEGVEFQSFGDLDNDGDLDVVAIRKFDNGYQVFLNQSGELTALPFQALVSSAALNFRTGLGDVDGDGNLDAFYTHYVGGHQLRILPGNGDGTFAAEIITVLEGSYIDHVLADIDGDGDMEVGIANEFITPTSDDVLIRWWDWVGGSLAPSAPVVIPKWNPDGVNNLAAVDVNSDGVPDLIAASKYSSKIHLLPTVAGAPSSSLPDVSVPFPNNIGGWINPGDLNGDGVTDVLATGRTFVAGGAAFDFMQPMYNTGAGSFFPGPLTTLPQTDYYTRFAYIDDWDHDGDGDVFLLNSLSIQQSEFNGFGLHDNDGNGLFKEIAYYHTGSGGEGAGIADMNGDGIRDVVGARCLIYGSAERAANEPETTFGGITGFAGRNVALVDLEDDGDLDVIRDTGDIVQNDATGRFRFPYDITKLWPHPAPPYFYQDTIAIDDFNGDEHLDAIVKMYSFAPFQADTFIGLQLLTGDGRYGFTDGGPAAPLGENFSSELGFRPDLDHDIDGDGDNDLIGSGGYRANNGLGQLGPYVSAWLGVPSATGDFDNDGDLDVLVTHRHDFYTADLALMLNDGAQNFSAQILITGVDLSLSGGNLVDLDEDGDLDIACGLREGGSIRVFQNNGVGGLTPLTIQGVHRQTDLIETEDFDGDGIGDLVTAAVGNYQQNVEGDRIAIHRRTSPSALTYEPPRVWVGASLLYLRDIDHDGDRDLVGGHVVRNKRYHGAKDGIIRQFGEGTAGSGGHVPLIGATGPLRSTSTSVTFRYRMGVGGAPVWLISGLGTAELPLPFPGGTFYLNPIHHVLTFVAPGAPGAPGDGMFDLIVPPSVLGIAAGATLYIQCFTADPGVPVGAAATQAMEFVFGL